jgi:hypothetical protein
VFRIGWWKFITQSIARVLGGPVENSLPPKDWIERDMERLDV